MNTATLSRHLAIYGMEARMEFLKTLRMPAFALPTLLFPAMFYLFFGVLFSGGRVQMATYLLATYATFGVIGPALFGFGVGIANERDTGALTLKRATPMPASAYFAAKLVMAMIFAAIVVLTLFIMGAVLADVRLPRAQWLGLAGVLIVGTLPFGAVGLAIGAWARSQAAVAIVNLTYLPMAFLSGLWIPIRVMPGFLQDIAPFLPPYHLAQLALDVLGLGEGGPAWIHVASLLAFAGIFLLVAAQGFRRVAPEI